MNLQKTTALALQFGVASITISQELLLKGFHVHATTQKYWVQNKLTKEVDLLDKKEVLTLPVDAFWVFPAPILSDIFPLIPKDYQVKVHNKTTVVEQYATVWLELKHLNLI